MNLRLVSPTEAARVMKIPDNTRFDLGEVLRPLDELRYRGHSYEVLDSGKLSEEERRSLFEEAARAAALSGRRVDGVFGSARVRGGPHFGIGVPALLVYGDGPHAVDVYPHETKNGAHTTIRDFLESPIPQSPGLT